MGPAAQNGCGLVDGAPGPGQAALLGCGNGAVFASCADRFPELHQGEVGQLLGDRLQPGSDVVELVGHAGSLRP